MEMENTKRVRAGWGNWKRYDERIPLKLKRKVHKTVGRPAMLYGQKRGQQH